MEKGKRGFGSMDQARQQEIARRGGRAVAPENRAFSRNRNLAAEAGRKGGQVSPGKGKASQLPREE